MNKNDHIYNFIGLNVQNPIDFNDMKNENHLHGNDPISQHATHTTKKCEEDTNWMLWSLFSTWTSANDFTSVNDTYPQHGCQMLTMFLMKIKFNIATGFLSTKLQTIPHIEVVKTYYKATIWY
jgi:hypothetical protein